MHKLRILTFVRFYLPGYKSGGPVRTVANMVESLGDEFEFRIVTSDRDMLDTHPYASISADSWNRVDKAWVYYVSQGKRGIRRWMSLITEMPYDVLYLNSLFDPTYTLLPLIAQRLAGLSHKPTVIAPRGELSPGARALKRWKKDPYLAIANAIGLYGNVLWHASTEDEAQLIRQQFPTSCNAVVARDLPAVSSRHDFSSASGGSKGPLRVVFLSRISKKKNLDFALRVLHRSRIPIQFDIWGPKEDAGYWKTCQALIHSMPDQVEAHYCGVAEHAAVSSILADYDLFFLPTLGENYGHVIAEALSAGTPVLVSDQTPWRNLAAHGVGWDLPLDDEGNRYLKAIEATRERISEERDKWRQRVYDYAKFCLEDPALIEANRQVFLKAVRNAAGDVLPAASR